MLRSTIQRRFQKIIEESPSPVVSPEEREILYRYTRRLARQMRYKGAGTIEYLRSRQGEYYFMEINARLQVEHPVSEMVTGIDIVQAQILLAGGARLPYSPEDIHLDGHAIEARVYAEDPQTFLPSPGIIQELSLPATGPDLRIDHALQSGLTVPPYYDPLLAKIIARGRDRNQAIRTLQNALQECTIGGIKTNIPLCLDILNNTAYRAGELHTAFLQEMGR
ncbi:MAG: ATP-binding protein [Desulfurispora sp.]|uniref:ATP-binding protein n=1 Tax=Desulfurispora sp. TaxID=3014275 RepID=UPI00404BA379